ncbi:Disease resistance protein RPM1 [Hordeum vulgare]|nr:Disease resistance protein RPM1 [Hordeum vulgare]
MAEIVILLAIKKIGTAFANGAADQASTLFAKYGKQILELQGSMGRVLRELRVMHDVLCQMDIRNRNNQVYEGWLEEVRKVAHVMEDMVDEYLYLVGHEHDTGCCFYLKKGFTKPRYLFSLNRIAFKVKEIEKDLTHLSETKNRWVHMINNGDTSSSSYIVKSLFSEDYCFKRKQLIRLWTAEGFIEERGESTLEEVAEGCLKELIDRNMLQLVKRNSFGRMKEFKMHDILRELALDLCQKNCFGVTCEDKHGGSFERNGRRLVLHKQKKYIQNSFSSVRRLRTFVTLDNSMVSFTLLPMLCKESRYMTVLELSGLSIENIPDAIGDLFNLRHLGLRDSKVKMFPRSVEKFSNLLTLDLLRSDVHELPSGIVNLKKLRHLFVEKRVNADLRGIKCFSGVHVPNGLGNLTNLQTLQALVAHDESIRHLRELRQLRSLRLLDVKRIYCGRIVESLVQMQCLSHLDVNASDENEVLSLNVLLPNLQRLRLGGRLAEGALDESPLFQAVGGQNLHVLNLYWSELREDPLPSLSRLSNLTHLEFTRAYNGEQLAFLTGWFPKLKMLYLIDLPNLNRLEIQQGAMASLERLYLVNLSGMMEVPPGIEFLMPLQFLGFFEITSNFFWLLDQCSAVQGTQWRYTLRD